MPPNTRRDRDAPGGRCRQPGKGILKEISTPGVLIGVGTIHHNRLRLLEPADQTAVARHVGVAQSLGFERPFHIKELIARHRKNLNKISILRTVRIVHDGPGRPATEYWLNEEQALFITAKSDDKGSTTSASNGVALTTTPNETETPLVVAAGGLERAFWKG